MKKNIRMLSGILLHPFKGLIFRLNGGANQYNSLQKKAIMRAENKAVYRNMYMSSVTNTKL